MGPTTRQRLVEPGVVEPRDSSVGDRRPVWRMASDLTSFLLLVLLRLSLGRPKLILLERRSLRGV